MKNAILALAVLAGSLGLQQTVHADGGSKLVQIHVADAIIPSGFDSNSDAYVIVTGMFPNGCYSWAYGDVSHQPQNLHEVRSYATVRSGLCPMVMVPFHKEIQLGKLPAGEHTVRFINSDGTYLDEKLTVEQAR